MLNGNRAQVGVSTLIVFIAMVLTAAVAASVLLQTSGDLQQQAMATGEEAISQVSTKVQIQAISGYSTSPATDKINKTILTIKLAPGSDEINLDDVILSYQAENIYIRGIFYNSSASADGGDNSAKDFYSNSLKGDEDDILSSSEIIELHFWIEDTTGESPLATDTNVLIGISQKYGSPTSMEVTTPGFIQYSYTALH